MPIGALAIALCAYALRLPRAGATERIDIAGSLLLVGSVVGLLLITEWGGRDYAWGSAQITGLGVACVALFVLFVQWEKRAANPLLPMRLFANPALRLILPATAVLGMLLYGSVVFLPTLLQTAYDWSATRAGLALHPFFIPFIAVSAVAGGMAGKSGRFKPYLLTGAVVLIGAFLLLSTIDTGSNYGYVAGVLVILGAGFGLLMQNLVVVSQNAAAPPDLAATTANLSIRGLGMAVGASLFGNLLAREIGDGPVAPAATAEAIPEVFIWGVPLAGLLVVLLAFAPRLGAAPAAAKPDATEAEPGAGEPEQAST